MAFKLPGLSLGSSKAASTNVDTIIESGEGASASAALPFLAGKSAAEQLRLGAVGLTCATLREAEVMADLVLELAHRPQADLDALKDLDPRIGVGLGVVDERDLLRRHAGVDQRAQMRVGKECSPLGSDRDRRFLSGTGVMGRNDRFRRMAGRRRRTAGEPDNHAPQDTSTDRDEFHDDSLPLGGR